MKTKRLLMILSVFLSLTAFSVCDTSRPESEFLILISDTGDGLQLVCEEGCAWKELSFSLVPYGTQLIDQFGMTSQHRASQNEMTSNFLLSIQKTEGELHLESRKGTSWTQLNFSCSANCSQYIDQHGMTAKE